MHAQAIKDEAANVEVWEKRVAALDVTRPDDADNLHMARERRDRSFLDDGAANLIGSAARGFYPVILESAKHHARTELAHAKQRLRTAIADAQAEGQL